MLVADGEAPDAARRLDVPKLRSVLSGGNTNPRQRPGGAHLAVHVVRAVEAGDLSDEELSKRQVDALQLLARCGGLDERIADSALGDALLHCRSPAVVQVLLRAGANPLARDGFGYSRLHVVRRADVAALLLRAGASVHAENRYGQRPLHCVAEAYSAVVRPHQPALVAALLAAGAAVDALDRKGQTAIFGAVSTDLGLLRPALAPLLLDAGADPTIVDDHGRGESPLEGVVKAVGDWAYDAAHRTDRSPGAARHSFMAVVRLLARATAWRRRRHLLVAVRGRWAPEAPASSAAGSV